MGDEADVTFTLKEIGTLRNWYGWSIGAFGVIGAVGVIGACGASECCIYYNIFGPHGAKNPKMLHFVQLSAAKEALRRKNAALSATF
ncbi:hypothetical protein [uncultured Paenibacillus sp.]|uniref:hypothetical protein n=1 Tax=uncultured Paenibacillus sp. TaxID=227322 RepID=UPI0015B286A7|nr:hypothetical protein [uncultured Paenibacillus sp.]